MKAELSPRTLRLFAEAEQLAAFLVEINVEEARLRRSVAMLGKAKSQVMALLADAARKASMAEFGETLRRAVRELPPQAS